eukprot:TRINITY_DN9202_c0_g1_i1.p1 TRINITY_DN9202_c0_g1~~TRINITY_DN9202_c0_g1_i1.p1  ORF type:complete len:435 (-),score=100.50 TRINITY_DN9202_c0_g1_i1:95-1399(-)
MATSSLRLLRCSGGGGGSWMSLCRTLFGSTGISSTLSSSSTWFLSSCARTQSSSRRWFSSEAAPALNYLSLKSTCRACGIVGMPNVGKSTLFNALTRTMAAQAANYPFCTIDPNIGRVVVPDERLQQLATMEKSEKTIPLQIEFVDIAGLVRGASKGAGLGNQFLATIRTVSLIVHMVRCFEDVNITHVEETVDPLRDIDTINTELILADLDLLEKVRDKTKGKVKDPKRLTIIERTIEALSAGKPAGSVLVTPDEWPILSSLQLLTCKPVLYCCNVKDMEAATGNNLTKLVHEKVTSEGAIALNICANLESEVANLSDPEEQVEFLKMYNLHETGLDAIIKNSRKLLKQFTFYTVGPQEARAWGISQGTTAAEAAGLIHSDIQRGFIRAETISFNDFVKYKGEKGARDSGKLRLEGANYVCQDGDIFHFRFNV